MRSIYLNDLHFSSILYFSVGTQIDADRVVSRLRIQGATSGDTGNYTCRIGESLSDYPRGRVKVHVVDGNYYHYVEFKFRLVEKSSVIIVFLTLSTFIFILISFHFKAISMLLYTGVQELLALDLLNTSRLGLLSQQCCQHVHGYYFPFYCANRNAYAVITTA